MWNTQMIRQALWAAMIVSTCSGPAVAVSPLAILVEADGTSYLWNTTPSAVRFKGYQLVSEGNLDPGNFRGVNDYIARGQWQEVIDALGPGGLALGEVNSSPQFILQAGYGMGAVLQGGGRFPLGKPFATVPPLRTDRAQYLLVVPPSFEMDIVYVPEPSANLLAALVGLGLLAVRGMNCRMRARQ